MANSCSSNIFAGYDEPWGKTAAARFRCDHQARQRSASKSVVSLLVGIAIDRKLITSVDEPVVKFFPECAAVKTPGWDDITLRHRADDVVGHKWDENRGWTDRKTTSRTLARSRSDRYMLSKPIAKPPDTVWTYNGGGTDCSATSSNAFPASRWKRSRAKRCSSRLELPTRNG